jgi:Ca-activated chloride channel family protein
MAVRRRYNFHAMMLAVVITEIIFWLTLGCAYYLLLNFVPNIRFHNPQIFWGLALIPMISIIYLLVLKMKNRSIAKFSDPDLVPAVIPEISSTRSVLKFLLIKFGITFLLIALIDPKIGTKLKEVKTTGMDIMVCLDISNSMKAEDMSPNRLEAAKRSVELLMDQLTGDRVGVIVFAGTAYTQLPITTDYEAAKLFLSGVDTDMLSVQGTAVGAAIDLALESFNYESEGNRSIIVITDGENHEDDAINAAKDAQKKGVVVHAIGMGSVEGAPIPIYNRSGRRTGFKEDKEGQTVVTALNETMLRDLVSAGGGVFTRASGSYVNLNDLLDSLDSVEDAELQSFQFSDYEHRFQWFLLLGLACFMIDLLIAENKKKWSEQLNIFDV